MLVRMDYGRRGIAVEIPNGNLAGILRMNDTKPVSSPSTAVRKSLENPIGCAPLHVLAKDKNSACVVISDISRPVPNELILPPILDVLQKSGIGKEDIVILIATGIHRPNEGEELEEMLGRAIASSYHIINHDARDNGSHEYLGVTSGKVPIYVDSTYLNADLRILTGLIEPHLMAGYSGGRKSICPGICAVETVRFMHGPGILEHENAAAGIISGNPFHEGSLEIARKVGVDFILNVALNRRREITGVFAGDLEKAHEQGIAHVEQSVKIAVDQPADIVLVSSAGYPLDTTFYQAIKGMVAAMAVVKEGGSIILTAECADGLGGPEFTELAMATDDISGFVERLYDPDFFVIDQWMLEEMAKVVKKASVYCYCDGVDDIILSRLSVEPVSSPQSAIKLALEKHGKDARILVIPEGPYVLPVVAQAASGRFN